MAFSDTWNELQNIDGEDFKRIGSAHIILRGFLMVVACAAVIGLIVHFLIKPQFDELKVVEAKELELRATFDAEQAKAANRLAYLEQLAEMKKQFSVMLRQLPNKTDIESLLVDLSQTSVASGLEVEFFKPEDEIPRTFYAEYPIRVKVTGQYHQFGQFISGLAALPRIVTLSNIDIVDPEADAPVRKRTNDTRLSMNLTATTYRYLEEDDLP